MSFTRVFLPPVLTPMGVQLPCEVEFTGPVSRIDTITAAIAERRVRVVINSHPPSVAAPHSAWLDLQAASARHLSRLLEQLALQLEADGA